VVEEYEIDKEALRELSNCKIHNNHNNHNNNNGQEKIKLSGGGAGGFTSLSNDQFDKSVKQFEANRKSSWNNVNDNNNNSRDTTDITGGATEGSRGHSSCGWCLCHDPAPKKKRPEARS
jgi:hypothetical protein